MSLRCRLGKHRFGLPRLDASGATVMECLDCLRHVPAHVGLGGSDEARAEFEERRARAVADLIAAKRWVGQPSEAPTDKAANGSSLRPDPPVRLRVEP